MNQSNNSGAHNQIDKKVTETSNLQVIIKLNDAYWNNSYTYEVINANVHICRSFPLSFLDYIR